MSKNSTILSAYEKVVVIIVNGKLNLIVKKCVLITFEIDDYFLFRILRMVHVADVTGVSDVVHVPDGKSIYGNEVSHFSYFRVSPVILMNNMRDFYDN
ncbi:CLUMA_CG011825, isoform A [Clunio marinus]|uniref:CLUMA_CG011825, isoform A n=1 Tax=Clunio marinus TaxID=568069 RepID=A0A1J1IG11_9DIPT|nr:CLUMA_CG011825, isoform A [Clunio marinus]